MVTVNKTSHDANTMRPSLALEIALEWQVLTAARRVTITEGYSLRLAPT